MFENSKRPKASKTDVQSYKAGHILPVLDAKDLLGGARHQAYLNRLQIFCDINDTQFDILYRKLIDQFAEYVQLVPAQASSTLGGLLNEGLARALAAIQVTREEFARKDPLFEYAAFTAALMLDISKMVINQRIIICDKEGKFKSCWRPFVGGLKTFGEFYKIYTIPPTLQRIDRAITPLLARQLLPEIGFKWLSYDLRVLADWLDALAQDDSSGAKLTQILTLFKNNLAEILAQLQQLPFDVKQLPADALKHAEAFLNWLREGLANGDIKFNSEDAAVHFLENGMLLEDKLFKTFTDRYYESVNMMTVRDQFRHLLGNSEFSSEDLVRETQYAKVVDNVAGRLPTFLSGENPQRHLHHGMALSELSMVYFAQVPGVSPLIAQIKQDVLASHHQPPTSNHAVNLANKPAPNNKLL